MASDALLAKMSHFGLNKYEAKAYLALLQKANVTAYELGKLSGVPQGKIYEAMAKLLEKNLVNVISEDPVKYIAVSFDDYIDQYNEDMQQAGDYLKTQMKKIKQPETVSHMLHLDGNQSIEQKLYDMIREAEAFIYLETWGETYDRLIPVLRERASEGVEVVTVVFGEVQEEIGTVYYHQMAGMEKNTRDFGNWFTIVVDGEQSLFATEEEGEHQAIWTRNKAFMLMAESFILHDIFLCEIYRAFGPQLDERFGPNLGRLREKYNL